MATPINYRIPTTRAQALIQGTVMRKVLALIRQGMKFDADKFGACYDPGANRNTWFLVCTDFDMYMHDKKLRAWINIAHKKFKPFPWIACYAADNKPGVKSPLVVVLD